MYTSWSNQIRSFHSNELLVMEANDLFIHLETETFVKKSKWNANE